MSSLLMPKATAVWLIDNTALTFEQVAQFCNLHVLEIQAIADGDVGQGILGIEIIDKEGYVLDLVKKLRHEPTKFAADAERAFLVALGGGCNLPIAAYAQATKTDITIQGIFATEDGKYFSKKTIKGNVDDRRELARSLALDLKKEIELKKKEQLSETTSKTC